MRGRQPDKHGLFKLDYHDFTEEWGRERTWGLGFSALYLTFNATTYTDKPIALVPGNRDLLRAGCLGGITWREVEPHELAWTYRLRYLVR